MQFNPFERGEHVDPGRTYGGMGGHIAAMLGYLFFPLAIVSLALEKYNYFVRFHAAQALGLTVIVALGNLVATSIPIISCLLVPVWNFLALAAIILMMIKCYQCELYRIPWMGDFLDKQFFSKG